jgi:hypothetical protein
MGRGYTGQSKEDIAVSNMERMCRRHKTEPRKVPENHLLASLQEKYPHTWKEELKKMKAEHAEQNRNK